MGYKRVKAQGITPGYHPASIARYTLATSNGRSDIMPQIKTTTSGWADVYSLAGIAPGTALLVQNQSGNVALLQQGATAPLSTDNTGRWLQSGVEAVVDSGAPGLWIRCSPNGVTAYVQGATS